MDNKELVHQICLGVAWASAAPSPSYFPHRNLRSAPKISEKPGLSHAWMCIQVMASFKRNSKKSKTGNWGYGIPIIHIWVI